MRAIRKLMVEELLSGKLMWVSNAWYIWQVLRQSSFMQENGSEKSSHKFWYHIPVQSTALKRRKWGVTIGNKKSTSGRPPLFTKGLQSFKSKYKPIKRQHNLSLNVSKNMQNAGKWWHYVDFVLYYTNTHSLIFSS